MTRFLKAFVATMFLFSNSAFAGGEADTFETCDEIAEECDVLVTDVQMKKETEALRKETVALRAGICDLIEPCNKPAEVTARTAPTGTPRLDNAIDRINELERRVQALEDWKNAHGDHGPTEAGETEPGPSEPAGTPPPFDPTELWQEVNSLEREIEEIREMLKGVPVVFLGPRLELGFRHQPILPDPFGDEEITAPWMTHASAGITLRFDSPRFSGDKSANWFGTLSGTGFTRGSGRTEGGHAQAVVGASWKVVEFGLIGGYSQYGVRPADPDIPNYDARLKGWELGGNVGFQLTENVVLSAGVWLTPGKAEELPNLRDRIMPLSGSVTLDVLAPLARSFQKDGSTKAEEEEPAVPAEEATEPATGPTGVREDTMERLKEAGGGETIAAPPETEPVAVPEEPTPSTGESETAPAVEEPTPVEGEATETRIRVTREGESETSAEPAPEAPSGQ